LSNAANIFIDELSKKFDKPCDLKFPIKYREAVYIPKKNGIYEKRLATALIDTCYITSSANCPSILPIPNPPGFDCQLRLEGIEPCSKQQVFIAYIYWNEECRKAMIAFTGTQQKVLWRADARYQQVAPRLLNGFEEGMLVHSGFYEVYLAVRDQLWDWWNNNEWVEVLYMCGHSLGAALSTLLAFDFAEELRRCKKLPIQYTFGSPRVGNVEFAKAFNKRMWPSIRVNNTEDPVTALPLAQMFDYVYEQVAQDVPFTASLGSTYANHVDAYYYNLPDRGNCYIT
jgi:hypothetical protein